MQGNMHVKCNYIFVHVDYQQTRDFFTFTLKIF